MLLTTSSCTRNHYYFHLWLFIYIDNFRVILKIDDNALSNQCMRRNAQVRLVG